jgi:hypothetical protein
MVGAASQLLQMVEELLGLLIEKLGFPFDFIGGGLLASLDSLNGFIDEPCIARCENDDDHCPYLVCEFLL